MLLDVNQVLLTKNPKLHRKIPAFLIRWVEKLIHQDEMNQFVESHFHESSIDFATHGVDFFGATVKVIQEENIPRTGRQIIVSNHPLGGLDGVALVSVVGKHRKDIKFPVNDILMQITPMKDVFVPINKHGRNKQESVKELNSIFASDNVILYFPAGLCSRKQKGIIEDLEWKRTIISKARDYERDIIPAYFDGRNSNRFYNIANLRQFLHIKPNLEMVLLPDESCRQKGKTVSLTFGTPISYSIFDQTKTDAEWASWLKNEVYALKNLNYGTTH